MNHSRSPLRHLWSLDPRIDFLNHGAFGACPREVLERQAAYRERMEQQPLSFLVRELEPLIDAARLRLAHTVGSDPADLVFVTNATTGVNTVLRSLRFAPGEGILTTSHGYNACSNAVRFVAQRWGAQVQQAEIPLPVDDPQQITEAILAAVTPATRLAVVDHVTSPTALVFPIEQIVQRLQYRGVEVLIDGAHAPGMVPLDLASLGADYYTGNCHKWLCAPKGAAFLRVAPQHHERVRPLTISHGANSRRGDRSRLHLEFDWAGTADPTPWLCVGEAIDFLERLLPGGLAEVMASNRELALAARECLMRKLDCQPTARDEACVGSIAAFSLPDRSATSTAAKTQPPDGLSATLLGIDPLQDRLLEEYGIEVPVFPWPAPPRRMLRVACQAYNDLGQYEHLAAVLSELL